MDVHVVHLMPSLMEQQLDTKAAALLREDLEAQGMKFLMEKKTVKFLVQTMLRAFNLKTVKL